MNSFPPEIAANFMSSAAKPITVLQLSDLHLFSSSDQQLLGLNTHQTLNQILDAVMGSAQVPDVLLLTGDLAQDASKEAYQSLKEKFALFSIPIYAIPGNHDDPSLIQSMLTQSPFRPERIFSLGGWRFILLDSSVPGQVEGHLSSECLMQLGTTLSQEDTPTIIALHHPPYPTQLEWLNEGLTNYEDFWAILDHYPQVKIVLNGHIHQDMSFVRKGVQYWSTPSTCVQFKPRSKTFSVDDIAPGFRYLTLGPNAAFHSQIERVEIQQQVNVASLGYE